MTLRGARVLLAGACTPTGRALAEAFVALGAHVVAADRLRTGLEELRAALRQHERLWVAESDLNGEAAALRLFRDVARDEPIDAALLVVPQFAGDPGDAFRAGAPLDALEAAVSAVPRCLWFLRAALACMADAAGGRVIVVLEPGAGDLAACVGPAVAALTEHCAAHAAIAAPGLAVAGLTATAPRPALLERLVELADRDRPAGRGWLDPR